jgi:hypothetical protein
LDPLAGLVGQQKKDGKERAMEKTIATLERGKTVDVRVRFVEWHGKQFVDIRTWMTADATGDRVPTRKGISIPISLLPDLERAISKAHSHAWDEGLLKDEDAAA